ncbi:tripartite tricarboxylate transporter substrate-binding protein [Roseomonas xinghualingensis]|uniref:tripartite tricarboxylate transporter substrate-binding protein n=1 Tax=Roseomonas xinghualingensis TaxID=2986475 RepID=UPI00366ECAD5
MAYARARPGQLSFGSSGHGASTHTAAELFRLQAGLDMQHVPYRGSGAAINDLMAGTIQMMAIQIAGAAGQIRDGQVKALAATGPRRHPLIPDVPSIGEAGFPGAVATSWGCVMAPGGTPAPIIARLNQSVVDALTTPAVQQRLSSAGVDGEASTPDALAAFLEAERVRGPRRSGRGGRAASIAAASSAGISTRSSVSPISARKAARGPATASGRSACGIGARTGCTGSGPRWRRAAADRRRISSRTACITAASLTGDVVGPVSRSVSCSNAASMRAPRRLADTRPSTSRERSMQRPRPAPGRRLRQYHRLPRRRMWAWCLIGSPVRTGWLGAPWCDRFV